MLRDYITSRCIVLCCVMMYCVMLCNFVVRVVMLCMVC